MTTTLRHPARPFQSRTAATIDLGAGSRPAGECATMATMTAPSAPPPLHLVLGDEELLVERAVRDIVDAARAVDPEVEVRRLRAPRPPPRTWPRC